jgi:hypothetical protein
VLIYGDILTDSLRANGNAERKLFTYFRYVLNQANMIPVWQERPSHTGCLKFLGLVGTLRATRAAKYQSTPETTRDNVLPAEAAIFAVSAAINATSDAWVYN